ncbi:SYNPR protein, partial [Amia calva]|nr:SYNPR protein [Amia calva]
IFSIFAFATCGGYSGKNIVSLFCKDGGNETLNFSFSYPFKLSQVLLVANNSAYCNHTVPETHLVGDASSSAEFFVAISVLAFLYSMATLVIYLGYMHIYRDSNFGPVADFLLTSTFAVLWLVCSSAWARGLHNVKYATNSEGIAATLSLCGGDASCLVTDHASMRSLNVSVVFGFLNMILWAGNAWFLYKETSWHKPPGPNAAQPSAVRTPPGAGI